MASTKLNAINSVLIKRLSPNENFASGASAEIVDKYNERIIFQFETASEQLKYKILTSVFAGFFVSVTDPLSIATYNLDVLQAGGSYNVQDLTWNNYSPSAAMPFGLSEGLGTKWHYAELKGIRASNISRPLVIIPGSGSIADSIVCYTEKSAYVPYLEIIHEDEFVTATVTGLNFQNGFYNRLNAANFKWEFEQVENSIEKLTAGSETFYWRKSEESLWNSIDGNNGECHVPANTFPAGDIEWYVSVTDNLGRIWSSPTYIIDTTDSEAVATPQSPKGGFANERAPITFTWLYSSKYNRQSKAEIQWGLPSPATWQNLATIEGDLRYYTAPAGVIESADTVWWRIRSYNADGRVGEWSEAVSFSTVDTAAVATPIAPSNTVEDGEKPISFEWEHSTDTGTEQTAAELQWSSDGSTWNDLATVSGSSSKYSAPANTFPGGAVYWRVRTYNSDNVAGDWSRALSFISIAAPPAPVVAADGKAFATIRWQSSGQLAYTVKVDDVEYGPYFGTSKEFALRERLGNGNHRATVKVQGAYGLWSEEGHADFQVNNIPGAEIILDADFSHVAQISWQTQGDYTAYQIYRNGKLVGKSSHTSFADNLAIGDCTYLVVGIMADGNYTESNSVKGQINLHCTMICDLERGEWQKLELSAKSYPEKKFSMNQQSSSRHFCGAALPVLELSQHRNISGSYEVAFKCRKDAEAFEALLGKVVCIKSKPADMIIGGLLDLQKLQGEFYAAYSFSVSAIYWEDYRDDTDS